MRKINPCVTQNCERKSGNTMCDSSIKTNNPSVMVMVHRVNRREYVEVDRICPEPLEEFRSLIYGMTMRRKAPWSKQQFISNKNTEKKIFVDEAFFHYLVKELQRSPFYNTCFMRTQNSSRFIVVLLPTKIDLIDYRWNDRVFEMVRERCELDHALSWLSTLGGAFSALGDYFPNCAEIARKISINQFKLALRLGDPTVASRCRLYFSLSLIQQRRFPTAKRIIYNEFQSAKTTTTVDERLLKMCKGIWSKLQYEQGMERNRKKLHQISVQ